MTSKFNGWCFKCKTRLDAGTQIFWDPATRKATHAKCASGPPTIIAPKPVGIPPVTIPFVTIRTKGRPFGVPPGGSPVVPTPPNTVPEPEKVVTPKRRELVYPAPEAYGEQWKVVEADFATGLGTDVKAHSMTVPLDEDSVSAYFRALEMGKARISPDTPLNKWAEKAKVSSKALAAAETMRVNYFLRSRSVAVGGPFTDESVSKVVDTIKNTKDDYQRLRTAVYSVIGSNFTPTKDKLLKEFKANLSKEEYNALYDVIRQAENILRTAYKRGGFPTSKASEQVAKLIKDLTEEPKPEKEEEEKKESKQGESKALKTKVSGIKEAEETIESLVKEAATKDAMKMIPGTPDNPALFPIWGKMSVEMPPLKEIHKAGMAKKRFASDVGDRIRKIHRYATDGKIFSHKRRVLGGSCLIDCSGSMGLNHQDILEIIEMAPASRIAIYSGTYQGNLAKKESYKNPKCPDEHRLGGCYGLLKIIAKDGRIVSKEECKFPDAFGNNIVDGPALKWLARQPLPRYWVSDGHVTGCCESTNPLLYFQIRSIMRKNYILRFENLDHLKLYIKKQRIKLKRKGV